MKTISGFIRTEDEKIWFWITWWEDDTFELPVAA